MKKYKEILKKCYNEIFDLSKKYENEFVYFDAMKSPIGRIKNKHRYQILIRLRQEKSQEIIDKIYDACDKHQHSKVSFFVEINPSSLI